MMKRILLSLVVILMTCNAFASHQMGGEITWQCLGPSAGANAGKYVFTVRFYRDCTGILPTMGSLLVANHPTISSIPLSNVAGSPYDLSPPGCQYNCTNAATAPFGTLGLVNEFVWRTAPTSLGNFTPPAAGWIFYWTDCCRNTVNNLNGGSSMLLRAKMFSYNGQLATPCFDNSPNFAEKPSTYICSGYTFTYNHTAFDRDLDSLRYTWDSPMDGASWPGTPVPFLAPYSPANQLPGGPVLDQETGEVTYFPPLGTQGNFATCVRVDGFKCNIKVAEIYREIQVNLSSSCPPIWSGGINTPPSFLNIVTNLPFVSRTDTVFAGDSVDFEVKIQDFNLNNGGGIQDVTLNVIGAALDSAYFAAPAVGCDRPPCATLNKVPPVVFLGATTIHMNWKTSCAHLPRMQGCVNLSNKYTFVFKAVDDYCPAPGRKNVTFTVVVKEPPKLLPPVLRCASVDTLGHVTLSWTPPTPKDTFNTFYNYQILRATSLAGPWVTIDSVMGYFSGSYTDVTVNAQQQSYFYTMQTRCGCDSLKLSDETSDTLQTLHVTASFNAGTQNATVQWNPLCTPQLPATTLDGYYYVYRTNHATGVTSFVDSTLQSWYIDSLTGCIDSITWKVGIADSIGCISWSSLGGATYTNDTIVEPPIVNCVSVQANGDVSLEWSIPVPADSGRIFGGYLIYRSTTSAAGPYVLYDSIVTYTTTGYVDVGADAYTGGPYFYYVVTLDSCGMIQSDSSGIVTPMILSADTTGGNGNVILTWNDIHVPAQAATYEIWRENSGTGVYTLLGTSGTTNYSDPITFCKDSLNYYIRLYHASPDSCSSYSTIDGDSVLMATPTIDPAKLKCTAVAANGDVTISWEKPLNVSNYFDRYIIYQATAAAGPYTQVGAVTNYNTTTFTHSGTSANTQINYYRIVTRAGCDASSLFNSVSSDTIATMLLNVSNATVGFATLTWNPIHTPLPSGSGATYRIMRRPTGIGPYVLRGNTSSLTFNDTITQCNVPYEYTIELDNTLPCFSVSSADNDAFTYIGNIVPSPTLRCVSVQIGGPIDLTWNTSNITSFTNFNSYEIYRDGGAGFTLLTTINASGTTTYTDATANGNAQSYSYYLMSRSGCTGTEPSPTNSSTLSSIFLTTSNTNITSNPATAQLNWTALSSPLPTTSLGNYGVYSDYHNPPTIVGIGTTTSLAYTEPITDCDTGITHMVSVGDNSGCISNSNRVSRQFTYRGNVIDAPSLRCVDVQPSGQIVLTWNTSAIPSFTNFNSYEIYSNSGAGFNLLTTINASGTTTYTDASANGNSQSYGYYITTKSGCTGTTPSPANSATLNSIFLTTTNTNITSNPATAQLNWTALSSPLPPTSSSNYAVLSDYHNPSSMIGIGSTSALSFSEPVTDCDTGITHMVTVGDNSGCVSNSNIVTRQFTYLGNVIDAPSLRCVDVQPAGQVVLTWNTSNITSFANFNSYEIYKNSGAGFNLLTTINASGTTTYTDGAANANSQSYSYYMVTKSGCTGAEPSPANSSTLSSIFLTSTNGNIGLNPAVADLGWNALVSPLLATTSGQYDIFSDYHNPAAPVLIGDTAALNYSEPIIDCDTGITHIVKVSDASGCVSTSNVVTRQFTYLGNVVDAPSLRCVNVLPSGQVELTWNTSNITSFTDFDRYEIYSNSGSGFNLLTTLNSSGTTTFTDATANGNSQAYSYYMLTKSGCTGNVSSPANSATLSSIFLTTANTNISSDPANADLSWTALSAPLPGTTSGLYDIYSDYHNSAAPVGIGNTALLNYTEPVTDCDTGITHLVKVADASGCVSQSNIVTRQFTYLGKIVAAPDLHCVSVLPSGQIELTWDIANIPSFTDFNSYEIYKNAGSGISLLTAINTSGTTTFTDPTANGNAQSYSYYMLSRSGCSGIEASPSHSSTLSSIFLTTANSNTNNDPANADLTWTALVNPLPTSTSGQYDVFSDYHNPAAPIGIGSTAALNYTEPVINCDTGITHVVKVADALGCTSQSNIVTRQFTYLGNVVESAQIRCVNVIQPTGAIELTWVTNPITDFTNFNSYEIYRDNALLTNINTQATTTYQDVGTNGNTASHNYYMLTRSGCTGTVPSLANSDTMNSIYLTINVAPGGVQATLNWNPVHDPALAGTSNTFDVYKRPQGGNDVLVASGVNAFTLIDSNNVCGEFINYRVVQLDAVGNCQSNSNFPSGWFEDKSPPADPVLISASVNPNDDQTVTLQWISSPNPDVDHYQIYVKNNFNAWDSIGTTPVGVTAFSTINPTVDLATQYYDVIAVDSCGNKSTGLGSLVHGTIHSTALMDICRGAIDINWNPYLNMPGGVNHYNVYISQNGGVPGPPVYVNSNLIHYSDTNLVAGSIYCYYVTAVGNTVGYEALSNGSCDTAELLTLPQFSYLNKASVIDHRRVIVEAIVDTANDVDISRFKMQRSVNRTGPFYTIGVIMFTGSSKISYLDNTAQTDETSYFYRMITLDSCGNEVLTSNVGRTILLTGNGQYNLTNKLYWNDYEEWLGGVNNYSLFRKVDDIWSNAPIFNPLAGINEYMDNVGEIYQTSGRFCYKIAAYEGAGNPYGFADTSYSNEFCLIQEPHLFIPSAFTPDGQNPIFKPEFIYTDAKNYNFSVYNRWGQKIFETENPNDGWNGKIDGDNAPEGTYVYSLRMYGTNGQELNRSGRVSLLR